MGYIVVVGKNKMKGKSNITFEVANIIITYMLPP